MTLFLHPQKDHITEFHSHTTQYARTSSSQWRKNKTFLYLFSTFWLPVTLAKMVITLTAHINNNYHVQKTYTYRVTQTDTFSTHRITPNIKSSLLAKLYSIEWTHTQIPNKGKVS